VKRRLRLVAVASLAVIAAAGCSSDSDPSPDPVGVDICVHLQDVEMEITQQWVDALERYGVTIEGWEWSPDLPFGAGEAGDLVERREAFVERIANEDCGAASPVGVGLAGRGWPSSQVAIASLPTFRSIRKTVSP
jgi:hypothetical protein